MSAALEEAVSKHPPGVVLPPKDIRAIVEKTAGYVARNGTVFADRIKAKEANNTKFSFLTDGDAYNPFYQWRLDEIRAGRGTDVSAGRVGEVQAAAPEKPKGPQEPPAFEFSTRMPTINAKDLDVVRLTALFAAKNGRQFTTALTTREAGNFQFDFLRATHSLYPFFSRMVDQYSSLLNAGIMDGGKLQARRLEELRQNVKDKKQIMDRAKVRAEWQKFQLQQQQKKEENEEKERLEYAQVDWHDFVVAETIEFTDADDEQELLKPMTLGDLQTSSLDEKAKRSLAPASMRIEEAMPTDEMYYDMAGQPNYQNMAPMPVQPAFPQPPPPQTAYAPMAPQPPPTQTYSTQQAEEDEAIRARAEARDRAQAVQAAARSTAPMRIRNDYVPRAQANRKAAETGICPNCKQAIPFAELEEHMRIEMLNPEWKKQKAKADARYATTNLAPADVANNLKRLASQRSDVFDPVTGQQVPTPEEEARFKQQRVAVPYDGQPETRAQMQGLNIEEQIRQIHQKFKQ